eukprot:scaffold17336_cov58-Phaeocystis_antarctica.AAC.8
MAGERLPACSSSSASICSLSSPSPCSPLQTVLARETSRDSSATPPAAWFAFQVSIALAISMPNSSVVSSPSSRASANSSGVRQSGEYIWRPASSATEALSGAL